jgi:hypothetical protein
MVSVNRTFRASKTIQKGEKVIEISRSMQIWDLDAVRDPFVKEHLLKARYKQSKKHLGYQAYSAAFLGLQKKNPTNRFLKEYYEYLPTYEDYLSFHPVMQSPDVLATRLNKISYAYGHVRGMQLRMEAEYEAFCDVSPEFCTLVSAEDYKTCKLNVISRMFEKHPADRRNALTDGSMTWEEEVDFYIREIGRDFSKSAATLVPILDSFNHHRKPNVLWGQNNESQAFYLVAGDEIPAGAEVMDSYGLQADSVLFSTYGFNNGDGSGVTLAKLAPYHHIYDEDLFTDETGLLTSSKLCQRQRKQLLKSFEYDNGYATCLQGPADDL